MSRIGGNGMRRDRGLFQRRQSPRDCNLRMCLMGRKRLMQGDLVGFSGIDHLVWRWNQVTRLVWMEVYLPVESMSRPSRWQIKLRRWKLLLRMNLKGLVVGNLLL